jgi:hypothetical protein
MPDSASSWNTNLRLSFSFGRMYMSAPAFLVTVWPAQVQNGSRGTNETVAVCCEAFWMEVNFA